MHLTMIGAGYVGLVSGACLADFGHDVICVDNNPDRIALLNQGKSPIYEPGLDALLESNRKAGRLRFTSDLAAAVAEADAVFLAVGTPSRRGDGHADLSFVRQAVREVAAAMKGFTVIVTKSTVPVGTGDEVEAIVRSVRPEADFAVVSNPEFLREGSAIEDFKRPNRIVIGSEDERASEVMGGIYRPLSLNQLPILYTGRRTAELIKYASNAFLAAKITFINEMADLCEAAGADIQDLARGIGLDQRIGSKFLHPGPGYGGSCFPKDTLALIRTAEEFGVASSVVTTVADSNARRKRTMARRVINALGGSAMGKHVAVLGLTFKPNTDDMRESPALDIIDGLQAAGATVAAFDPVGMDAARPLLDDVRFATDAYDCAAGADALLIVTEWDAFRALNLDRLRNALRQPLVVDFRNVYSPAEMVEHGFAYHSVGRPAALPAPRLASVATA
ncbi:MAG: UDP-glucose/GDP-mannose dehydrogenase family protein [Bauldia sp.]|nr:UDP-glucose/GDP-mannose dehydrogenase family protein [Bauldia sp.]